MKKNILFYLVFVPFFISRVLAHEADHDIDFIKKIIGRYSGYLKKTKLMKIKSNHLVQININQKNSDSSAIDLIEFKIGLPKKMIVLTVEQSVLLKIYNQSISQGLVHSLVFTCDSYSGGCYGAGNGKEDIYLLNLSTVASGISLTSYQRYDLIFKLNEQEEIRKVIFKISKGMKQIFPNYYLKYNHPHEKYKIKI